ncbi:MAG TPA: TrkA family potassium uptake protein [Propionibacteriaceae bacterium]|nr:TrkA family potassium uptake protein [Propionibacteriaceae bacterium]
MKVLVAGGGMVGGHVAELLVAAGYEVTVVEPREVALARVRRDVPGAVVVAGSGTSSSVLEAAGVESADIVCAVTGADETNLMIATLAKYEFGVDRVLARVNDPRNRWLFETDLGVDLAVNQAELMARLVVQGIQQG